jgi:hypothetical protein
VAMFCSVTITLSIIRSHRMRSSDSIPGAAGITFIVVGSIGVSCIFTLVTQAWVHWIALVAALIVGYWTVGGINRN